MGEIITGTLTETYEIVLPDANLLVTEDDTPVDNLFSEKQQRLLVESLYASRDGTFLAAANVAIYFARREAALVPDVLVSLEVQVAEDWYAKQNRSYFVWEFGKLPELVVEIVSNDVGEEDTRKLAKYARWGIPYYIIFDPTHQLSDETLRVFRRNASQYHQSEDAWFQDLQIGAQLWFGSFEGKEGEWLRWVDRDGNLFLTGTEHAERERERAERERERAERERERAEREGERAEMEHQRAERLAAQLRALGIEPE